MVQYCPQKAPTKVAKARVTRGRGLQMVPNKMLMSYLVAFMWQANLFMYQWAASLL
ncbi:hypothetical protein GCM10011328_41140 [Hafnia psychrotolerans]|uniref:Uncharacterized protein n=1 Tax=Hafnia psychrotolerans TaxID=1477018 RepID=A0ABQ1H8M2_9GAMM|nr:hypothetical protein GCM10011328_41140 [Hafnia psychrotolerans]